MAHLPDCQRATPAARACGIGAAGLAPLRDREPGPTEYDTNVHILSSVFKPRNCPLAGVCGVLVFAGKRSGCGEFPVDIGR